MQRYKIKIEYEGTSFVGWQFQKNGESIQEVLQKASDPPHRKSVDRVWEEELSYGSCVFILTSEYQIFVKM